MLGAAAGCAAAAAALAACVVAADGSPVGPDVWFGRFAADEAGRWLGVFLELGSGAVLYLVLAVIAVWRRRVRVAVLPPLLVVGQVAEVVLLSALPRSAPDLSWAGASSGRTASAVLGAGLIAWALGAGRRSVATGLVLGAAVGWSRVASGAHWASDALLGLLAGAALLCAALAAASSLPDRPLRLQWLSRWTTSSWAWCVPAVACLVPLLPLAWEPAGHVMIDLDVYVGSAGVVGAGGDVYAYRTAEGLPFTYPPFAALLAEPLGRMPLVLVRIGWTVATLAAVVAVAKLGMRPVVARIGLPLTVALMLVSTPVRSHIRFGQVGVFLVLLVCWDLLSRTRRPGQALGWPPLSS